MALKFSMLTALVLLTVPMAALAQSQQSDDGLTPAQRASKKTSRPKATTPADTTAQEAPAAATQTTSTTTQQTPTQTQTTTTKSTTTATPPTPEAPAQTQTTTTKSTTTTPTTPETPVAVPTESSTTSTSTTATTTATDTQGGGAAKPATAADVKSGVSVYDSKGAVVGKIESVSGKNAVLASGDVRASIPVSSFAKNGKGLVIGMTKSEFEAAAKKK